MKYFLLAGSLFGLVSCEAPLEFGEKRLDGVTVEKLVYIPRYQTPPPVHYGVKKPTIAKSKGSSRQTVKKVQKSVGQKVDWHYYEPEPPSKLRMWRSLSGAPVYPRGAGSYPHCLKCGKPFYGWHHVGKNGYWIGTQ
ncbi:MAG: hypothetical protein V4509_02775 [Patescibacteria group bacterium]